MNELEAKVRLIEAASQLPGVRAGTDAPWQGKIALEIAQLWYTALAPDSTEKSNQRRKGSDAKALGI